MLALSSLRAQAGITARDLLVGCVAENDPLCLGQALRLVQSIRWFGGELAGARVMVCTVGGIDPGFRQAFESCGAEVRTVAPFPFHRRDRSVNKLQFFPKAWETDREMLLLLDCDTVVVQDPLPWVRRDSFQARIASLPTLTPEVLERVFRRYDLPLPARGYVNSVAGTATIRHCNPGMILLPSDLARQIIPVWCGYNARLAGDLEILHPCERQCHQVSLSLALAACPVPFAEAPAELNFQLNLSHFPPPEGYFAVDPAILHYSDRVDSEGYLLHAPYPFAQVRIEAFNRRLRQEREGRAGVSGSPRQIRERPAPPASPAAQVVVLGMHRSGTSALTGLLRLMGLWAGEEGDFPPADEHNEAGYWEHRGVWSVDEAILQALGASWSEVADLDLSRLGEGLRTRLTERAREIVRELDRQGSWVVKDPRLCLLFPFWREILEHPFCVLIYREPLPVARSLAARDGFPISYSIALWEKHTRDALASTLGLPRVLLSHRELMADPVATLRRLHGHLARHRPELSRLRLPTAEEIRAVLDPALVHHPHEPETERLYLTPPQLDLLDALADGSALDLNPVPPLSAGARDLLSAYQSRLATTRSLRDQLTAQTHRAASLQQAQEGLRIAHEDALASGAADLQGARCALASSEADLQRARDELASGAADLQRARLALDSGAEDLRRALFWLDELDTIFSALLDSRSWKIGRALTSAMGRLLGRSQTISAPERRDRLMDEVRSWRQGDAEE
jgi:hypothetical protein